MQSPRKFVTVVIVSIVFIGLGIYFNRRPAPARHTQEMQNASSQNTNHPYIPSRPTAAAETPAPANVNQSGLPKIPRENVEEYLRRHNRDMASLLAAFHALDDTNYLNEAATNFPNDPRLQWTILARNAFPEDRRKWLDSFKTSSPGNSLANYLSAQDYFKNNQPEAALKELQAASGKSQFTDYSMETILDGEALGQFGGRPAMETRMGAMAAMAGDSLPEMANFKSLANGIRDLQQQYLNSGDMASVQNLSQMGMDLANRLATGDGGKFLINQLVGIASQAVVLQSLDQNTNYDFLGGETPAQRLADLKQQKASIRDLASNQNALFSLSEDQMNNYWERVKVYGELEAMKWLKQQTPVTPNSGN